MNEIFDWCVKFLEVLALKLGMTYKEINVWIFCIIEPILFVIMFIFIVVYKTRLRTFKRILRDTLRNINNLN